MTQQSTAESKTPEQPTAPIATCSRFVQVEWIDLDATGLIRVERIVRWMEETEYEFLRSRGLSVSLRDDRGQFGFPRLRTEIEILDWPSVNEILRVNLKLADLSHKQLTYSFDIVFKSQPDRVIATGKYSAACCRFPTNDMPFPILIPDWVADRLTDHHSSEA
ncbi:MAG: acyl-CoA thioesterase [Pirellulaceae bacterium]